MTKENDTILHPLLPLFPISETESIEPSKN